MNRIPGRVFQPERHYSNSRDKNKSYHIDKDFEKNNVYILKNNFRNYYLKQKFV